MFIYETKYTLFQKTNIMYKHEQTDTSLYD